MISPSALYEEFSFYFFNVSAASTGVSADPSSFFSIVEIVLILYGANNKTRNLWNLASSKLQQATTVPSQCEKFP